MISIRTKQDTDLLLFYGCLFQIGGVVLLILQNVETSIRESWTVTIFATAFFSFGFLCGLVYYTESKKHVHRKLVTKFVMVFVTPIFVAAQMAFTVTLYLAISYYGSDLLTQMRHKKFSELRDVVSELGTHEPADKVINEAVASKFNWFDQVTYSAFHIFRVRSEKANEFAIITFRIGQRAASGRSGFFKISAWGGWLFFVGFPLIVLLAITIPSAVVFLMLSRFHKWLFPLRPDLEIKKQTDGNPQSLVESEEPAAKKTDSKPQ